MAASQSYSASGYPAPNFFAPPPNYSNYSQPPPQFHSQYASVPQTAPQPPSSYATSPGQASSSPSDYGSTTYAAIPSSGSSSSVVPAASGYDNSLASAQDPAYAPAVPTYTEQSYIPSYVDHGAATATSSYSAPSNWSSEFQLPWSGSYGSQGGHAVDGYNQTETQWSYEHGDAPTMQTRPLYGGQQASFDYADYRPNEKSQDTSNSEFAGVYAYSGGNSQPYGSKGTSAARWDSGNLNPLGDLPKLAKALPKVDNETKGGIQKYHVKLLQDSSSVELPSSVMCQIGLDGVRMLDPGTKKTLRIYPLETITKWEVNEPTVFTFWAKTAVDIEQRRIRLQSSTYTTSSILDTLTAACVQLCEMVGKDASSDTGKASTDVNSSSTDNQKKGTFADWLVKSKPPEQEKEHWVPDEAVKKCTACASDFGPFLRRHHCRNCGDIFCDKCSRGRIALTSDDDSQPVRVCDRCLAEVTQRLINAKELSSSKFGSQRRHEDLAKKLQEELERRTAASKESESRNQDKSGGHTSLLNCSKCGNISLVRGNSTRCPNCGTDSSSSSLAGHNGVTTKASRMYLSTEGSRRRTREVACPTCTVHLEVEVPSSGTETIECGVCQHPFLVNA